MTMKAIRIAIAGALLIAVLALEAPRLAAPSWAYDSIICSGSVSQVTAWFRSLIDTVFRQSRRDA
jgi:hypothetical protein